MSTIIEEVMKPALIILILLAEPFVAPLAQLRAAEQPAPVKCCCCPAGKCDCGCAKLAPSRNSKKGSDPQDPAEPEESAGLCACDATPLGMPGWPSSLPTHDLRPDALIITDTEAESLNSSTVTRTNWPHAPPWQVQELATVILII